jgi:hypothetical protein
MPDRDRSKTPGPDGSDSETSGVRQRKVQGNARDKSPARSTKKRVGAKNSESGLAYFDARFFLYVLRVALFGYALSQPLFHWEGWVAPKVLGIKVSSDVSPMDYTIKQFGPACLLDSICSLFGAVNVYEFVSIAFTSL